MNNLKKPEHATNSNDGPLQVAPKAYSYTRFSTLEQVKGDSLRRQTELAENYAANHSFVLDDSLKLHDLGRSAYFGEHRSDRAALGQFLKLVEAGKIEKGSILLVESLDRLSREEITKAVTLFLLIINNGIKIVTLSDNREYTEETVNTNVGDLFFSLILMSRAHEESSIKSMRISKAWENKRKEINIRKLTARCPAWLKLADKSSFAVIEDRAKVIRLIFDMKLCGKGAITIVRELNGKPEIWKPGETALKKGNGWRESYVKKILRNSAVIGEYQPHKVVNRKRQPTGDVIPDYYPPVVEKVVFYQVQERIRQNRYKGGKTGNVTNLFGHLAKCGYCGGSMAIINKGPAPKGGRYLICDRARRGIDCCRSSLKYQEFERLVLTYCKGLQPTDIVPRENNSDTNLLKSELDSIIGEKMSIDSRIAILMDSIGTTPDKRVRLLLEKQVSEMLDKKNILEKDGFELQEEINRRSRSFEDTRERIDSLRELYHLLDKSEPNKVIEIRLHLREHIRKLIGGILVFQEYSERFKMQTAKDALDDLASVTPKDSESIAIFESFMREVNDTKSFRFFKIRFCSGSIRTIVPERKNKLAFEYDNERKILRFWNQEKYGKFLKNGQWRNFKLNRI